MFNGFFENFFNLFINLQTDTVIMIIWGAYLALYIAVFIANMCSAKIKHASKRPFLSLTNAFTALTLSAFLLRYELVPSLSVTILFWAVGYVLYGSLCAFTKKSEKRVPAYAVQPSAVDTVIPQQPIRASKSEPQAHVPVAKSTVRLEHAVAVTDNLLTKNLAKSDRQELEKLKNTLAVLKIKGTLNPAEADILNDNFNALLKLMAKYNV